jgi:hypothetical protein
VQILKRSRFLWLALLVAGPVNAMRVVAPNIAENGYVVPVEVRLDRPMTAGQRLDLLVNGEPAAQIRLVEGKLSFFSTRVIGAQSNITITARVIATNGRELDSASYSSEVRTPVEVSGSTTTVVEPMKVRTQSGDFKVLMTSKNGFAGTLVVQDAGFRAEISGSTLISRNPFIGVKGEFSDQVSASINGQTQHDGGATQPQPVSVPSTGRVAGTKSSSKYSSVCKRNNEKIDKILVARGVTNYASSYDLFLRDYNLMGAKLYQPCVESDPKAADIYRRAMAEYDRINQYCAGPHESYQCTQWGTGEPDSNRNWYAVFSAEANKALSNPNYSADLDGGAAQTIGNKSSGVSSPSGTLPQDGACNLAAFDQKFAEFTRRYPQKSNWGMNDTFHYSYFLGSEGLKILQGYLTCMSDEDFAANYQALKGMRDKGREGCIKTSNTGDCQPSYPGQ